MFGKRILIAIPHPDDEVVACAAAIGRAKRDGAEIFALYLTHGCIARKTLWPWQRGRYDKFVARRRAEAEQAAKFLGITPAGNWPTRPARHLWRELPQAQAELAAAIAAHNIDQLWVPAYEGGNADHDGLNALASLFIKILGRSGTNRAMANEIGWGGIPPVLEFAEYNFFEGRARRQEFPLPNGSEQLITLSPAEKVKKRGALAIYKSEKKNLGYVGVGYESFRALASYDYSRPPHEGTLWYARFQWVPFPHPRVDFTKPEDVSAALIKLLKIQG